MKQLNYSKTFVALALVLLTIFAPLEPLRAQSSNPQPAFEGKYIATDYNYGGQSAPPSLTIDSGGTGTGSQSYVLRVNAFITLPRLGGRKFMPLATNAPILLDTEVVTPSAVSCTTPDQPGTCIITVTVANVHGGGSHISSGTFGLQEAINDASQSGSGRVQVDPYWFKQGGTLTMLNGTHATSPISFALNTTFEPNPVVVESIGISGTGSLSYWYGAPGLTLIATPAALSKAATPATLTTSTTGGTIATATTPRFAITLVDQFGGETAASDDSNANATLVDGATATNSYGVTCPTLPAGAVGCRLYVSATGGTTQTETLAAPAQITCATSAPLSPLAGTCGAGVITLTALPATTAAGPPQGTAGAATALSSAHTTVVAKQAGIPPTMLPFNDTAAPGYWPVTVTSATTLVAGFDVMGELQYPANFFNSLGSKYQICGGGVTTPSAATVAGTWNIRIGPRENSAGTSGEHAIVPFGFVASRQWTAAASHFDFCTDITVSTVGTSGVLEGSGTNFCVVVAAGDDGAGVDTCVGAFNAASTATDLTVQGVVQVSYVQTAASWTVPQLRYLTIRRL